MAKSNRFGRKQDAVFLGWIHFRSRISMALYNIALPNHPSYGSTVTEGTLRRLKLCVPPTPPPDSDAIRRFPDRGVRVGTPGRDAERSTD